jgi:Regulator of chromosome condensation (RCC1) repeat
MNISRKRRPPLRLSALVALSVGLLFAPGAAQAQEPGTVVAWGCGAEFNYGQCNVPSGLAGVTAISASDFHSLALKGDGSVVAWGCGFDIGQCSVPSGLSGVTAIAAGTYHSLALKSDGTVVAWGCGDGADFGQCSVPSGLAGLTAIAAGTYQSLALKGDGTVVAWGCGIDYGQCSVPSGLSGVTAIAANNFHSLALKGDGTVVAWGCADGGDGGQCNVPSGLSGVIAIAAGTFHSLALKGDGTVVAWGCGPDHGQCSVPSGLSGVRAIAAGFVHSLALEADRTVVAWGCLFGGDYGQCSVPSGLSGVTAIAAGTAQSLALVGGPNRPPACSGVRATPNSIWPGMRDQMALITLSGAVDPDGDALSYHIDGSTQDEYVTGIGDDTFPDAALTPAGADSNQVYVRSEANAHFNGRVYRIAYTVADGHGGTCSGTAGPHGNTTAKVGIQRRRGIPAIDDGDATSWDSFTGAPIPLLWNKLGSENEVTHSADGPNLVLFNCQDFGCGIDVPGTLAYPSGVFGGAASITDGPYFSGARVHTALLRNAIMNPEHGAVEAWYRQESDPVPFVHNPHRIFGGPYSLTGIDEVNLYSQDAFDSGDPRLHFAVFFGEEPPPYTQPHVVAARSLVDGVEGYPISAFNGQWIHIAGVWDRNGIAGTSDTVRLYVNGEVVATAQENDWGTTTCDRRLPGVDRCFLDVVGCNDTCADTFAVDNLKVWGYAKTDYSDRFEEGFSAH